MNHGIASLLLAAWAVAVPVISTAAERSEPLLRFSVISDIHVRADRPSSQEKLRAALADLHAAAPEDEALVINGDLTEGRPEDYRALRQVLTASPKPDRVYFTIGNHEFYRAWYDRTGTWNSRSFPNGETESASIGRFLALTGEPRVYYARTVNGFAFLFLGSERYRQSDPRIREDAYLSPEQLDWLRARLAEASRTGKPIFLFLHQPLPGTVAGTDCCGAEQGVVQHRELRAILVRYPQVILFTGHTHRALGGPKMVVRRGFVTVNSSSVAEPWTNDGSGEARLFPDASEGLHVEVYADRVVVRGRDFARQTWIPGALYTIGASP